MNEHWTKAEIEALAQVASFEELAEIGVAIVTRMGTLGREIVQVCGPMSTGGVGNLEANMARFRVAVDRAIENGLTVFDQIPFQEAMVRLCAGLEMRDGYYWEILEVFYTRVFATGQLHRFLFLSGWEESVGAKWEREVAQGFGIAVEEYPHEWLL